MMLNHAAKTLADMYDEEYLSSIQTYTEHLIWVNGHVPPKWWLFPIVFQLLSSRFVSHKLRVWLAHKTWKEVSFDEK